MAVISSADSQRSNSPKTDVQSGDEAQSMYSSHDSADIGPQPSKLYPQLQYHHQQFVVDGSGEGVGEYRHSNATARSSNSDSPVSSAAGDNAVPTPGRHLAPTGNVYSRRTSSRPASAYSTVSDASPRGRTNSPSNSSNNNNNNHLAGPAAYRRSPSTHSAYPGEARPVSYVDLLNVPYHQQIAPASAAFNNTHLRTAVGSQASLLSHKQTLDMYRANVKKTNDPAIQYEFAVFMVSEAKEAEAAAKSPDGDALARTPSRDLDSPYVDNSTVATMTAELYKEARQILQKLADRSYPFAQYYLADGYSSGLFTKGKPDLDKAFGLFVAAAKHGHAESGFRAGLCYEFGWGCRKDYPKAVQFYRQSASKNHPGAMLRLGKACLTNDLGLGNRYREGIKWLKRATESADSQYNSAPYELGVLHETGYGDDVFRDVTYAAQLFTQAAELGNADANYRMGVAYEHGLLNCPRDAGLSVHFYNGAAQLGHALAMMALCAWYIVGAEPILEKDESEAYEWARRAAQLGLSSFLFFLYFFFLPFKKIGLSSSGGKYPISPSQANSGDITGLAKAQYAIGYFTEMGIGCRRDTLEANVWYVRAADQGEERAKQRLAAIQAAAAGESTGASGKKGKMRKGGPGGNVNADGDNDKDCILM
jgi:TPR repeat protein